jgi:hypothetical protein
MRSRGPIPSLGNHKEASSSSVAILAHGYAERVMRRRIPRVAKPQREDILTDCKQSVLGGAELLERPFLRWAAFLPNLLLRAMNEGGREGNAFQSQVEGLYHTILSTNLYESRDGPLEGNLRSTCTADEKMAFSFRRFMGWRVTSHETVHRPSKGVETQRRASLQL